MIAEGFIADKVVSAFIRSKFKIIDPSADDVYYNCTNATNPCNVTSGTYVDDVYAVNTVVTDSTVIEGNLYTTNLNVSGNLTVIGRIFAAGNAVFNISFSSQFTVQDCIVFGSGSDAKLEIYISQKDMVNIKKNPDNFYTLLQAVCLVNANFSKKNIIINEEGGCRSISLDKLSQNSNNGLYSATFSVKNTCESKNMQSLALYIVIGIVGGAIIIVAVLVAIPKTRNAIFPNRKKNPKKKRWKEEKTTSIRYKIINGRREP